MKRGQRCRGRGQAMIELALTLPLLLLICLGAADLAQGYRLDITASGAARAGMKAGIESASGDIGQSVRDEPNSVIDANTAWGDEGPGGTYSDCISSSQKCGDPHGCLLPPNGSSPFVTNPGQTACFAIDTCTVTGGTGNTPYSCTAQGNWGTRPTSAGQGLLVKVVVSYRPFTPLIGGFAGNGGVFYLTQTSTGLQCNC
jgi:hypothetical protein